MYGPPDPNDTDEEEEMVQLEEVAADAAVPVLRTCRRLMRNLHIL